MPKCSETSWFYVIGWNVRRFSSKCKIKCRLIYLARTCVVGQRRRWCGLKRSWMWKCHRTPANLGAWNMKWISMAAAWQEDTSSSPTCLCLQSLIATYKTGGGWKDGGGGFKPVSSVCQAGPHFCCNVFLSCNTICLCVYHLIVLSCDISVFWIQTIPIPTTMLQSANI